MPPGVSWGPPPAAAGKVAAVPAAASRPQPAPSRDTTREPVEDDVQPSHPPDVTAMPTDNYDSHYKVGEVWLTGIASFYGPREQGRDTASGEKFDFHQMTAASRLLPLGTTVRVTDLKTNKAVVVRINDRGPFWPNRVLDLSLGAARAVGNDGLDPVRMEIVSLPNPLPEGYFTVQVGWFSNAAAVQSCQKWMEDKLHKPVTAFGSDTGRWVRYAEGVHLDRDTATDITRELREKHYPAYLVRLN